MIVVLETVILKGKISKSNGKFLLGVAGDSIVK